MPKIAITTFDMVRRFRHVTMSPGDSYARRVFADMADERDDLITQNMAAA